MEKLIRHTEFLLLHHEYVIIPDFGGFVLNREPAEVDETTGHMKAPKLRIGFNVDLKFNDGLLAESYMKQYDMPYESALQQIEHTVKCVKALLKKNEIIQFGSLGCFRLQEGYMVFQPSSEAHPNHPVFWGYADVNLKRLGDIQASPVLSATRKYKLRPLIAAAASVAAAVLLLVMPATFDNGLFHKIQQSGFWVNETKPEIATSIRSASVLSIEKDNILNEHIRQMKQNCIEMPIVSESDVNLNENGIYRQKLYYIIVGGDTNRMRAEQFKENIKNKGFRNATIVEAPDRYRIYIASFNDINEANSFLLDFREKYPAFRDAWVFSKTVRVASANA